MIKFKHNNINNNFLKISFIMLLLGVLLIGLLFTNAIKMIIIYPFITIISILMIMSLLFWILFLILMFIVTIFLDKDFDDFINNNKARVIIGLLFISLLISLFFLNYQYTSKIKYYGVYKCKNVIINEKDNLSLDTIKFLDKNKDKYCINKDIIPDFLVNTVLFDKNKINK